MKLSKVYQPSEHEDSIYHLWEKHQAFRPHGEGKSYSIVFPPPNANGDLHIGHALTLALQDIQARYHRLKGESVLFVPGADHAGFETQVVYERELAKQGKSRFDFSREELYQQIWDFVDQNRENLTSQLKQLGASFDWTQFTFTLDDKVVRQVYATFKKMWDQGYIYRGERLVNFCTFHGTAFADIEVEYKEEKGKLWHLRYPLTDHSGEIIVATTRPETMLGDTAVAVHPDDPRYKSLIGKTVTLPLTEREVPIIADSFVDISFGTGAVKITPAHDPNDFEVAKRHNLPFVTVIDHKGEITHDMPEAYRGLKVKEARQKIAEDLDKTGSLEHVEDYRHSVGHCYKCGTVIEPMLREQWFVDMKQLTERAVESLKKNEITFYPASKKDQLITYLEQLKDWNISRQIAWGIPIPAFQNVDNPDDWIYDERLDQETIEIDGKTYHRDPDVFDTWFSSSSWPYVTLGFPDNEYYKQFYPLSLMDTGGEILYPWVSRMIMLGLYVTNKVPFESVYIHGYVMAEDGTKMSKSLGNVLNPIAVIEKYGSDALRMGIIAGRSAGINRGYDHRKVEDARNFCNKLWNVARYIEDRVGDSVKTATKASAVSIADEWILDQLNTLIKAYDKDLGACRFAEAYDRLYHFVWDDFADWYVETAKLYPNPALLAYCLEAVLKLAHPFAPFVTEAIWQSLAWRPEQLLATSQFSATLAADKKASKDFEQVKAIVSEIRYITAALKAPKPVLVYSNEPFIADNADALKHLARLGHIRESSKEGSGVRLTQTSYSCWLDIDKDKLRQYLSEIESKKKNQANSVKQLKDRLSNNSYVSHAPASIVAETKDQLANAERQLEAIENEYHRFREIAGS